MSSNALNAISPIDGRYSGKTAVLSNYFSEKSLMRSKFGVEHDKIVQITFQFVY